MSLHNYSIKTKCFSTLLYIIILVFLFLLILTLLAFKNDNNIDYNVYPSSKLITTSIISSVNDRRFNATDNEINGLISYFMQGKVIKLNNKLYVTAICLNSKEPGNNVVIYTPVRYKNKELLLTTEVRPTLEDERLKVKIVSTRVGSLRIPRAIVVNMLKRHHSEKLSIEGDSIYFRPYVDMNKDGLNVKITLQEFGIDNGLITLRTKADIRGLSSFVKDKISSFFSNVLVRVQ